MKQATRLALVAVLAGATGYLLGDRSRTADERSSETSAPSRLSPTQPTSKRETMAAETSTPSNSDQESIRTRIRTFADDAAQLDARATLEALKKLRLQKTGPETALQQQILIARFAELDPETALSFADTMNDAERNLSNLTILGTWTANDPETAADYVAENSDDFGFFDANQSAAIGTVASEWAAKDLDAALEWAAELPIELQGDAYNDIAGTLAINDPARATRLLESLPEGYERNEASGATAAQWAVNDPDAAAEWALALRDSKQQAGAVSGLVGTWMKSDPAAASAWVDALPEGAARDAAVVSMSRSATLRRDPEAATLWTDTIQDEAVRIRALRQAADRWIRADPAAAAKWLGEQGSGPADAIAPESVPE